MTHGMPWTAAVVMIALFLTACQTYRVIPKELEGRVNKHLSYEIMKSNPEAHRGELVVWGGEVLQSTRLKNMTRLEILQLPLTSDYLPSGERAESKGRFVAYDRLGEILDPAVVQIGSRVTIVGQVQQAAPASMEGETREYPAIEIRDMTLWNKRATRMFDYPYYGPYYGVYYYGYRPYVFQKGVQVEAAQSY